MFLPVCTSQSVGGSFSPDTMFRNGVPPHMTWSPVGGTEAVLLKFGSAGFKLAAAACACPPAPPAGAATAAAAAGAALSAARTGRVMLVATRATAVAQTPDRTTRDRRA